MGNVFQRIFDLRAAGRTTETYPDSFWSMSACRERIARDNANAGRAQVFDEC
jgi:hypothetical protein